MRTRGERVALTVLGAIPLAFLALFFLWPLLGMLLRGLAPDGVWDLGGFTEVFGRERTARVLRFTAVLALTSTALTMLLGVPLAYVLYRLRLPGRRVLRTLVLVPFVLPTVVVGVAFRSLLSPTGWLGGLGLDGSPVAVVAACVFFNLAVVVRTVGTVWAELDPRRAEAAATLGAGPWRVLRDVTLPALRPALVSSASVVFLYCATAFGIVLVLGGMKHATIESEIYLLTTTLLDLRGAAALSVVQLVIVLLLLVVAERARRRVPPTAGALRRAPLVPVAPRHVPLLLLCLLPVALVALPLGSLIVRSLQRSGEWTLANYTDLASPRDDSALPVSILDALATSWRVAVLAALLSVALGLAVAVVSAQRARTRAGRAGLAVFDGLFMVPLGVSAVTIGFGFLITLDRPPVDLRDSPWLVPLAQAVVALPLVLRILVPVLVGIDDRQRQAAATLGAGPWRRWRDVDLRVLARPLLAATGFALAISLGEFGATSFLARPESPTVPVVIFRLLSRPGAENLGKALSASVVLSLTTAAVMFWVERREVRSVGAW